MRRGKRTFAVLAGLAALLMTAGWAQARDRDEVTIRVPAQYYVGPPAVVVTPPQVQVQERVQVRERVIVPDPYPPTVYSYSAPPVYSVPPGVYYGPSGYYTYQPYR